MLGCTVQHVRLLIRDGRIQGSKLGRDWLALRTSVVGYSERRYSQLQPQKPAEVHEPQREQLSLFAPDAKAVVNVASVPQRSPFRYPGGKTWLIPIARTWMNSLSAKPSILIEPFAGGGGIGLMAAFEGFATTSHLVELDPDIAVVWRVLLGSQWNELSKKIQRFSCTPDSVSMALHTRAETELDRAFLTILRNRVSRGGILAPGAGLVKTGEGNRGIASRWYPETLAKRIQDIAGQQANLSFEEADGLNVIERFADEPTAVFFVDPPYPVAGKRLYRFHDLNHQALFRLMSKVKGDFLITYDHNEAIEALAEEHGFVTRLIPMKSTHHRRKFELLIGRKLDWLIQPECRELPQPEFADPVSA